MPSRVPSPSSISKKYIEVAILEEKLAAIVVKVRLWDVEEDALRLRCARFVLLGWTRNSDTGHCGERILEWSSAHRIGR